MATTASSSTTVSSPTAGISDIVDQRYKESRRGRKHGRSFLTSRALLLSDLAALSAAFVGVYVLVDRGTPIGGPRFAAETGLFVLTLPLWFVFARALNLYGRDDARADHSTVDETFRIINLVTLGSWAVFVIAWATKLSHPQYGRLVGFWALSLLLILAGRVLTRSLVKRSEAYVQTSVVLGAGHVGQLVARKIQQHPEYGIKLIGFVDENPRARRAEVGHVPVLGGLENLDELVSRHEIERVIVAFSGGGDERTMTLVRSLRDRDVIVDVVPRLFELVGPRADIHLIEGLALITVPPARLLKSSLVIKRVVDLVGAGLLLLLTSPIFLLAAIKIKRETPGPVFFRQTRLGMNMKPFTALKFRTMNVDIDQQEHLDYIRSTMDSSVTMSSNGMYKLDRQNDVTRFGRRLRKLSLDELPQLLNILRGDMSLVGPRPCIEYETQFFKPHHFDRFLVPQGLTGLWQVAARANATFGEALEMDVAYVRGWSLSLDLTLLFRTPFALLRQRRATA